MTAFLENAGELISLEWIPTRTQTTTCRLLGRIKRVESIHTHTRGGGGGSGCDGSSDDGLPSHSLSPQHGRHTWIPWIYTCLHICIRMNAKMGQTKGEDPDRPKTYRETARVEEYGAAEMCWFWTCFNDNRRNENNQIYIQKLNQSISKSRKVPQVLEHYLYAIYLRLNDSKS